MPGDLDNASLPPDALRGLTDEQSERLGEVLDQYLASLESGEPRDRQSLLQEHPDLSEPLRLYLDKLSDLHNFAAGFSPHLASDAMAGEFLSGDGLDLVAPSTSDTSRDSRSATGDTSAIAANSNQTPRPLLGTESLEPASADSAAARVSTRLLDGDLDPAEENPVARRLGDFELLRVAGRGGMGIVYEAQQLSLRRRVALKLLPLVSVLDARQIVRFKNEAQAAASLQHPHIVPVYAVGNYQGVHFYAMRYIDGQPLDAIIAALRSRDAATKPPASQGNPVREGINSQPIDTDASEGWAVPTDYRRVVQLGIQAASALASAHEDGIVHRDIKPSNLMVDKEGKLWVTDFGLARRVNDHSLTASGDLLGTLRYMSPEQARGQAALVDGRSDIYSLGATLYELLALEPAIVGDNSPTLLKAIENQNPAPLKQLRSDLPRDLVTVIETAMAKNREERYLTAQHLADDLVRVLEGRPTLAKPPTLVARATKWALRHQRAVQLTALGALVLTICASGALWMIIQGQMQVASARYKLQISLQDCYADTIAELEGMPGAEPIRERLLIKLLENYRSFVDNSRKNQPARADLAMGLLHLGDLYSELGDLESARLHLEETHSLYKSLVVSSPNNLEYRRQLAISTDKLGRVLAGQADPEAAKTAREAVEYQSSLVQAHPDSPFFLADLARSTNNLALLLAATGQREEAEQLFRSMLDALDTRIKQSPNERELLRALATTYNNFCSVISAEDPKRAVTYYERSLSVQDELVKSSDSLMSPGAQMAVTYSNLGKVRANLGDYEQACDAYQSAIAIQQRLLEIAPTNRGFAHDLSISLNNLALAEMQRKQIRSAETHLSRALEIQKWLIGRVPNDAGTAHDLGGTYNNLATLLQITAAPHEVDEAFENALRYQRQALDAASTVESYRQFMDNHLQNYAGWLRKSGREQRGLEIALQRRGLWPADSPEILEIASDLADAALQISASESDSRMAQKYADAAWEHLTLAENAGSGVQSLLSQEPFLSLAKSYRSQRLGR